MRWDWARLPVSGASAWLERAKGIEPSYAAWEAAVLPLNYARGLRRPMISRPPLSYSLYKSISINRRTPFILFVRHQTRSFYLPIHSPYSLHTSVPAPRSPSVLRRLTSSPRAGLPSSPVLPAALLLPVCSTRIAAGSAAGTYPPRAIRQAPTSPFRVTVNFPKIPDAPVYDGAMIPFGAGGVWRGVGTPFLIRGSAGAASHGAIGHHWRAASRGARDRNPAAAVPALSGCARTCARL